VSETGVLLLSSPLGEGLRRVFSLVDGFQLSLGREFYWVAMNFPAPFFPRTYLCNTARFFGWSHEVLYDPAVKSVKVYEL
jgi:hypothetical protein